MAPLTSARKRDADATKASIIDAAENLFLEKGFADVSLTQLASAAGVTKSLIHHHFGSKEKLWAEVKLRFFADYFETLVQALTESPPSLQLLTESVKDYFEYLRGKPNFARMNCWMMLEEDDTCADMAWELIRVATRRVREAQEIGEIRSDLSPDHVLISFLSMVENWFLGKHRWRRTHFQHLNPEEREAADLDEPYLEDVLKLFLDGVRGPGRHENA